MEVAGKTAIITGASSGIGRAIAIKLAGLGANIVINYSSSHQNAEETLREVKKAGAEGIIYQANVGKNEQVEALCKEATRQFGRVDMLVNNAGVTDFVPLDDLTGMIDEYWDRAFNVNVKGMFYTSRACEKELKKNKGCIVNITSIAGFNGRGSSMAYAASKAAGISVTKSLAQVFAPEVRVNSIAPGIVLTRWVEGQEDHIKKHSDGTPLGRAATPEDVADMTNAIIQGGDFVTGQTIVVDGGWTL